jgi:small subunit ribosomal protein S14
MAKLALLQRELKRISLNNKYNKKIIYLLEKIKNSNNFNDTLNYYKKIQKLPKNSFKTRIKNRCWKTGKAKGYYRFFGLCRNELHKLGSNCYLPGIIKSSW